MGDTFHIRLGSSNLGLYKEATQAKHHLLLGLVIFLSSRPVTSPPMALPLHIPRCVHTPAAQYHLPPPDQPLRIQIEGPLVAIQRLLPHTPWLLGYLDRKFPQPAGPELARLTYQAVYGRDVRPEVLGDLVVQDEYLGWMPEKRPEE
jgi:hypothetical protein